MTKLQTTYKQLKTFLLTPVPKNALKDALRTLEEAFN